MTERELGDFSKWPLKDLMEKQRSFPVGHRIGSEIQAEIDRRVSEIDQRRSESNQRYTKIGAIVAIISFVLGAVYGLDRGIYLGSSDRVCLPTIRRPGLSATELAVPQTTTGFSKHAGICSLLVLRKSPRMGAL
jgi:hypothetical protein